MSRASNFRRLVTPGAKGRWRFDQYVGGHLTAPFALARREEADGSVIWRESSRWRWRPVGMLIGLCFLFGVSALAFAFVLRDIGERFLAASFGVMMIAFGSAIIALARWRVLNEREVTLRGGEVRIARPRRLGSGFRPEVCAVDDVAVRVHPLDAISNVGGFWHGWCVVIEAGQERVCLAAHKDREDVLAFVHLLPSALVERWVGDGPRLYRRTDRGLL